MAPSTSTRNRRFWPVPPSHHNVTSSRLVALSDRAAMATKSPGLTCSGFTGSRSRNLSNGMNRDSNASWNVSATGDRFGMAISTSDSNTDALNLRFAQEEKLGQHGVAVAQ